MHMFRFFLNKKSDIEIHSETMEEMQSTFRMKDHISIAHLVSGALALLMLVLSIPINVLAKEQVFEVKNVRVGYFTLENCMEGVDEDSRKSGLAYEILCEISKYSKWNVEFVYGDFEELYQELEQGKIDVLPCVCYTPERAKHILFSDDVLTNEQYYISTLDSNAENIIHDPAAMNGKRIAVVNDAYQNELLDEWCSEMNIQMQYVYSEEFDEQWKMVENGQADYIYNIDNTSAYKNFRSLFYIGKTQAKWAVSPQREDLVNDINDSMKHINEVSPFLISHIEEKYFSGLISSRNLSQAEEEWLLDHTKITFAGFTDDSSLASMGENGIPHGLYPDISYMIFDRLGIDVEIEWKFYDTIQQMYEALHNGEVDLISEGFYDYPIASQNGVITSDPINEVTMSILSLDEGDIGGDGRIAVANTRLGGYYAMLVYPDAELVCFSSVPECVDAVARGKAQYAIAYSKVLQTLSENYNKKFLIQPINIPTSICYAARPEDPELISIMNRGLQQIATDERTAVEKKYITEEKVDYSTLSFVRRNRNAVLMIATVVLILLLYAANRAVLTRKLKKNLEEIETLRKKQGEDARLLEESLAMAQSASRAKTTFLNNMSHDIRTPMNAIIGYTGMAASHIDNKEQVKDYLSKINQASDHLLSLINDVLDMSRIESGKVTIQEKTESLAEILHNLRDIVNVNIKAKKLDFYLDVSDVRDENVICDKLRLNQVLINILSNSIKYTPAGGMISVRLSEKGVSDNGYGKYEFVIKDTGIGMSKDYVRTIFDPFTREKSSTVSGIEGTGLGMAITKNIVDMFGGTIDIYSEEGKGTEVVLNLDFKIDTQRSIQTYNFKKLEGARSLVVDDDVNASMSVSHMLKDIGMRSDWCASGKEAILRTEDAIRDGDKFRVYIIDWLMPDMNGIETTRRIRKIVGNDAPIIILTAYDWEDIEDEAKQAGVTGFISKPLFASDLNRLLYTLCGEGEEVKEEVPKITFSDKKILLVEDNEMNREIAKDVLNDAGFEVDTAEDGTIAVEKMTNARPGQYDLILMDVQMPIMDGYEATKRIRSMENPDVANIPILAMTANAFEEDRQNAIAAGMNEHLAKPIDIEKLVNTLAKFIK